MSPFIEGSLVGKTSLLMAYTSSATPTENVPKIFENYSLQMMVPKDREIVPIQLDLWDTAAHDSYDRLRPLSYPETDVFLLCFSIVDPQSFKSIECKWLHEIKIYFPYPLIIVVGTKADLRDDPVVEEDLKSRNLTAITHREGQELTRRIGAAKYFECSSETMLNIREAFDQAIKTGLQSKNKKNYSCALV